MLVFFLVNDWFFFQWKVYKDFLEKQNQRAIHILLWEFAQAIMEAEKSHSAVWKLENQERCWYN